MLIFISYSSKDKLLARKLKAALEHRNLKIWLDEASIRVGHSIPDEIATAIKECDIFCILISNESIRSKWVKRELNSIISKWISGKTTILPCKLDKVEMPTLINDIKYADFSESFKKGFDQLLDAVRIREEVQSNKELKDAQQELISALSPLEAAFFVTYFSINQPLVIKERDESRWDNALSQLVTVGALSMYEDRFDKCVREYILTDKGYKLLKIMETDIDKNLLQLWARNKRWLK